MRFWIIRAILVSSCIMTVSCSLPIGKPNKNNIVDYTNISLIRIYYEAINVRNQSILNEILSDSFSAALDDFYWNKTEEISENLKIRSKNYFVIDKIEVSGDQEPNCDREVIAHITLYPIAEGHQYRYTSRFFIKNKKIQMRYALEERHP